MTTAAYIRTEAEEALRLYVDPLRWAHRALEQALETFGDIDEAVRLAVSGFASIVGVVAQELGSMLEQFSAILSAHSRIRRRSQFSTLYIEIAAKQARIGEFTRAEAALRQALQVARLTSDAELIATLSVNLASALQMQSRTQEAMEYYRKVQQLGLILGDPSAALATTYANLAAIKIQEHELETAAEYLEIAIRLDTKLGRDRELLDHYEKLALVTMTRGDLMRSDELLKQIEHLLQRRGVARPLELTGVRR